MPSFSLHLQHSGLSLNLALNNCEGVQYILFIILNWTSLVLISLVFKFLRILVHASSENYTFKSISYDALRLDDIVSE